VATSRPAEREDLDALLDSLLRFAQETLRKYGEFYPFGNTMRNDGIIEMNAATTGSDRPASQELIELLISGMREKAAAREIRAAGLAYDVRVTGKDGKPTDAIAVALEHVAGDAAVVLMPYSKGRLSGLRFGDLSARPGERRVFS